MASLDLRIAMLVEKFTSDLTALNPENEYDFKAKILSQEFCKLVIQTPEGKKKFVYDFQMTGFAVDLLKLSYDADGSLRALLVKRSKNTLPLEFAGLYAIPGGFLNYGKENALMAALREVKEETGTETDMIAADADPLLNRIYHLTLASNPSRDPRQHTISKVYTTLVKMDDNPLFTEDEEEISGVQWVPIDTILDDEFKMAFDHKDLIQRAYDMHIYIKSLPTEQQNAVFNVLRQQL
jgi:ADP-ribose pyrophosphatase YjhB (NUDIX family)